MGGMVEAREVALGVGKISTEKVALGGVATRAVAVVTQVWDCGRKFNLSIANSCHVFTNLACFCV